MDTEFHKKHEALTEKIYNTPGMLPSRYVFILTNQCNLRCYFCFQKKEFEKENMNGQDWINLTKQLPDYARVTLTGGEPLMFPEFEKVFSYVANKFDCSMISNGLLLTEEKIDYLLSFPKFKVLSISIDDVGNNLRGVKKEQWTKLENKLKYFKNKKKPDTLLDTKTTILDENADKLFDIYKYLIEDIGADTHAFQFLKGSPIQHADFMFGYEDILKKSDAPVYKKFGEIKKQLEKVKEYNLQRGKSSFVHPKVFSLDSDEIIPDISYLNNKEHDKTRYQDCKFPWSSIHVNYDGNIFPCLAVSMGDIRKKSLIEIVDGEEFEKFKRTIKEKGTIEACNRCGWLRLRE